MKLFPPLRATRAAPRRQTRRSLFMLSRAGAGDQTCSSSAGAVRPNSDLPSPSKLTCFKGIAQVAPTRSSLTQSTSRVFSLQFRKGFTGEVFSI